MSRRTLRILDLALHAYPRDRRNRDGDVIRDLAVEMVEGGSSASRQVAGLVVAGLSDRVRSLGTSSRMERTGTAMVALATLLAPIQLAIVCATLVATLLFDAYLPNNSLPTGFGLDRYWLVHAGLPWGLCLVGSMLAVVGFSTKRIVTARIGSTCALVGTWLVVGTIGGWMPWSGFVGPAELPIGQSIDGLSMSAYVIPFSVAITAVMFIGSIVSSDARVASLRTTSTARALLPASGVLTAFAIAAAVSPYLEQQVVAVSAAYLCLLPMLSLKLLKHESAAQYAFNAACIAILVFAAPIALAFDQFARLFSGIVLGPFELAMLIGMAAMFVVPFARALKQAWLERARS